MYFHYRSNGKIFAICYDTVVSNLQQETALVKIDSKVPKFIQIK